MFFNRETDFGSCYVRSAACKAFGVRENMCGLCAGADWSMVSFDSIHS